MRDRHHGRSHRLHDWQNDHGADCVGNESGANEHQAAEDCKDDEHTVALHISAQEVGV